MARAAELKSITRTFPSDNEQDIKRFMYAVYDAIIAEDAHKDTYSVTSRSDAMTLLDEYPGLYFSMMFVIGVWYAMQFCNVTRAYKLSIMRSFIEGTQPLHTLQNLHDTDICGMLRSIGAERWMHVVQTLKHVFVFGSTGKATGAVMATSAIIHGVKASEDDGIYYVKDENDHMLSDAYADVMDKGRTRFELYSGLSAALDKAFPNFVCSAYYNNLSKSENLFRKALHTVMHYAFRGDYVMDALNDIVISCRSTFDDEDGFIDAAVLCGIVSASLSVRFGDMPFKDSWLCAFNTARHPKKAAA